MSRWQFGSTLLTLLILSAAGSSGSGSSGPLLTPYTANYSTTTMGIGMTLERTLTESEGRYTLRNEGGVFIAKLKEVAHFTVQDGQIQGQDFLYKLGGIVDRRREVKFLPESGKIQSLRKKRWTEHTWSSDILDRLSQQEQLRLELMASDSPPSTLQFRVIDGPRVRTRTLELAGRESIETPLGVLDTVHYRQIREDDDNRTSDIWVAPELDYFMVKTVHREKNSTITIELKDLTFQVAE